MNLETIKQTWLKNGNLAIGKAKEIQWLIERVEQLEKELAEVKENDEFIICPNCGMVKND